MVAMGSFMLVPPEITSGLMYAGAGAGPLLAVASAWDDLEAELTSAAHGYQSIIADLSSQTWLGPAATAMATAATPYATWLGGMAVQAGQTATQAKMAAGAYEAAHAGVVPPPVITANRTRLMTLIATNVLGQNFPAIAATELEYYGYWIQDATVMDTYQTASTQASTLSALAPAPQTANPAGSAGQTAAVGQAQAGAVGTQVQQALGSIFGQGTSSAAGATTSTSGSGLLSELSSLTGISTPQQLLSYGIMVPQNGSYVFSLANSLQSLGKAFMGSAGAAAGATGVSAVAPALSGAAGFGGMGTLASSVTAGVGQSGTIGGLSVPTSWAAATPVSGPTATLASATMSTSGIGANPAGALNGMPMLANAARAAAAGGGQPGAMPRFDLRPTVVPISPAAG